MPNKEKYRLQYNWQQAIHWCLNFSLLAAILLIANGFAPHANSILFWLRIPPVWSEWGGAGLTVFGTSIVAISIFFDSHDRKSDEISYFLAPIAVIICIGSLIWMIVLQKIIPDVVNGVAILGLSASILRSLPFSDLPNLKKKAARPNSSS